MYVKALQEAGCQLLHSIKHNTAEIMEEWMKPQVSVTDFTLKIDREPIDSSPLLNPPDSKARVLQRSYLQYCPKRDSTNCLEAGQRPADENQNAFVSSFAELPH